MYAELADFSRPQGGAVPVRPDAVQTSDYADITQFSAPKQDPTYANVPRADATYANVQGMWEFSSYPQKGLTLWQICRLLDKYMFYYVSNRVSTAAEVGFGLVWFDMILFLFFLFFFEK